MRINGFEQIKAFYSWVFNNQDKSVKPYHISLYNFLINQNNRNNWVEWFKCPYDLAMNGSCISNKKTYYKALNDLQEWELIQYKKGINEWKAPLIKLEVLYVTATYSASVPQSEPLPTTLDITLPTNLPTHKYKLITNNLKRIIYNIDLIIKFLDDNNLKNNSIEKNSKVNKSIIFTEFKSLKEELLKSEIWLSNISIEHKKESTTPIIKALDKWLIEQKSEDGLNRALGDIQTHFARVLRKRPELLVSNGYKSLICSKKEPEEEKPKSKEEIDKIMMNTIIEFWKEFKKSPSPKKFLLWTSYDLLLEKGIFKLQYIDLIDLKNYIVQANGIVKNRYKSNKENILTIPTNEKWIYEMFENFGSYNPKLHYQELVYKQTKTTILWNWFKKMVDEKIEFMNLLTKKLNKY